MYIQVTWKNSNFLVGKCINMFVHIDRMIKWKILNNCYNSIYNRFTNTSFWDDLATEIRSKKLEITYAEHFLERKEYRGLEIEKVEYTIKKGKLKYSTCRKPNKLCFQHYFGKKNETYTVIVRCYKTLIQVRTTWQRKGR
jgi:hypothetical protein